MCDPCKVAKLGPAPNKPLPQKPGGKPQPQVVPVKQGPEYGDFVRDRRNSVNLMKDKEQSGDAMQRAWTDRVKRIVAYLYDESWPSGKGKPPGQFAFVVSGSAGRQQTCPYSDLDAFIVTESDDPAVVQKFDAASRKVKKHLEDINSIDSSVADKGFIFCTGGLNPLVEGANCKISPIQKPKLTGSAKEFAKFLEGFYSDPMAMLGTKAHLAEGMLESAFAFGDESLFQDFVRETDLVMGKTCNGFASRANITRKKMMGMQVMSDALKPEFKADAGAKSFDIKKHFMRTPQFAIKGLAFYYDLSEVDPTMQLTHLEQDKRMHARTTEMMRRLLEIPQRIRIRAHLQMKGENDKICFSSYNEKDKDKHYVLSPKEEQDLKACMGELEILKKMGTEFMAQKKKSWGSRKNPFKQPPNKFA
ncbi:MAG TPA: DUF294 nucleotidyltransferase-like domain-containing protein [Gammaproteobacteria bacterium]|nr:DUF294 nucleotidyltransferase-like domain-containing protein [Gammaproteobacteria bacterium]